MTKNQMTKNQIKVLYTSKWEEGSVETEAVLNLETGVVSDIEASDEGEHFEDHIKDFISIAIDNEGVQLANITEDDDNNYKVEDPYALAWLRQGALFEVLTSFCGEDENIDTVDGASLYFRTEAAAAESILEHLIDVAEAVKAGDMAEEYEPSEYLIRSIATNACASVSWADKAQTKLAVEHPDNNEPAPQCR